MFDKRSKRNSNAWAISDRSGMRFHMKDMIKEPGTGYLIHRSESDGRYNAVDHPQAHIDKYARFGDPFPVENSRPDISHVVDEFLTNEDGLYLTNESETYIDVL